MTSTAAPYPVHVRGRLDPGLNRWLWLVKWFLAIPHYVVLTFLWLGFSVVSLVAFFAILITGRYPRPLFDFAVGVLRWTWRVSYYAYGALGTDRYPPFSLGEEPDYPATLEIPYPEHLSRGLVLVKWWLLAIPHYLVVGVFVGGGYLATRSDEWAYGLGGGLVGVLALIAGVMLLFTGRYPQGLFDFVLGLDRWVLRVAAYAGLLTDAYPPFRLDTGGDDPTTTRIGHDTDTTTAPAASGSSNGHPGRIVAVVVGALPLLTGGGLLTGGAPAVAPEALRIWTASASGADRTLDWTPQPGQWTAVVMNTDGTRPVTADLAIGATAPALGALTAGLVAGGCALVVLGVVVILLGAWRRPEQVPATPEPEPVA